MKKVRVARQTSEPPIRGSEASLLPEWVREMREHFQLHGWYRAQDLRRVLGDPLERVEVPPMASGARLQPSNDKKD